MVYMRASEEGVGMNDLYQNTIPYLNIPLPFSLLLLRLPLFRRDPPPPVPPLARASWVTLGIRLPIPRPGLDPPHHFTRLQKLRGAMDPNTKLLLDRMKWGRAIHLAGDPRRRPGEPLPGPRAHCGGGYGVEGGHRLVGHRSRRQGRCGQQLRQQGRRSRRTPPQGK
jgi:hypothetical protein